MTKERRTARALLPGLDVLPRGPRRDFVKKMAQLDEWAGYRAYRELSKLIRDSELPATLSPNTITAILKGRSLGNRAAVVSLAKALIMLALEDGVAARFPADYDFESRTLQSVLESWEKAGKSADESEKTQLHAVGEIGGAPPSTYFPETPEEVTSVYLIEMVEDGMIPAYSHMIVQIRGPGTGQRYFLHGGHGPAVIGRAETCHMRLTHASVSRSHAVLEFDADGSFWTIRDNGSVNRTYVNRQPLDDGQNAVLKCGGKIQIGAHRLMYIQGAAWQVLSRDTREQLHEIHV